MTTTRTTLGFVVSFGGLAREGTSDLYGIPITHDVGKPASSVFECPYVDAMTVQRVNGQTVPDLAFGASTVSPMRGDPSRSTLRMTIVLGRTILDTYPEIARYFMARDRVAVARLATPLAPTDTTMQVKPGGGAIIAAAIAAGRDVLHINRETLRAVSVTGDTVYLSDDLPGGRTRSGDGVVGGDGLFDTLLDYHATASPGVLPYPDDEVFIDPPFLRDREVVLRLTQDGGQELVIGRYWLESVATIADGGAVEIVARDLLRVLWEAPMNDRAVRYTVRSASAYMYSDPSEFDAFSDQTDVATIGGASVGLSSIWSSSKYVLDQTLGAIGVWGCVQIEDRVFAVTDAGPGGDVGISIKGDTRALPMSKDALPTSVQLIGESGFEVLISHPEVYTTPWGSPFYDSDAGAVAVHPLDLLRQFLGTKPSLLPPQWRVTLPASAVDDAELVRLRDGIFAGWRAPGIVAFGDGEAVEAGPWLTTTLLRPLGLSFAISSQGLLTVRAIADSGYVSAADIDSAYILTGRAYHPDFEATADAIEAKTAMKADGKPSLIIHAAGAIQRRQSLTRTRNVITLDAGALFSAVDGPTNRTDAALRYAISLGRIGALFRRTATVFEGAVLATASVVAGTYRVMEIYGLRDATTGLLETTPSRVRLYIYRADTDLRFGVTQIAGVIVPWTRQTKIGPAGAIVSVSTVDVTLEVDAYIAPLVGGVYVYGVDGSPSASVDADTFAVGDFVVARDARMVRLTDPEEVVGIAGSVITLGSTLKLTGGGPYVPTAGDVLTYARHPDCTATQVELVAFIDQDVYTL